MDEEQTFKGLFEANKPLRSTTNLRLLGKIKAGKQVLLSKIRAKRTKSSKNIRNKMIMHMIEKKDK